jgi:dTDP-4-amino-4,6-dideoxygalactose transaminase
MPYYQQLGWKTGDLPYAEKYYSQCISIPMFPSLTAEEATFVVSHIRAFYGG